MFDFTSLVAFAFALAILVNVFGFWFKKLYILIIGRTYTGVIVYKTVNKETQKEEYYTLFFALVLRTIDPAKIIKSISGYMVDKGDYLVGDEDNLDVYCISIHFFNDL